MPASRTDLLSLTQIMLRWGSYLSVFWALASIALLAMALLGNSVRMEGMIMGILLGDSSLPAGAGRDAVARQALVAFEIAMAMSVILSMMVVLVLGQLRTIVDSARGSDPFIPENGARLRRIGWILLGGNAVSIAAYFLIGIVFVRAGYPEELGDFLSDFVGASPFPGLTTVLLVFVLARIFESGSRMRTELQETV